MEGTVTPSRVVSVAVASTPTTPRSRNSKNAHTIKENSRRDRMEENDKALLRHQMATSTFISKAKSKAIKAALGRLDGMAEAERASAQEEIERTARKTSVITL
jgi:hypothetical protein